MVHNLPSQYQQIGSSNQMLGRVLSNTPFSIYASAARTTAQTGSDLTNYGQKGVIVIIDITAVAGTPSLTFTIEGKDSTSGKYYTILASAALTGTGTTKLVVYPGITTGANATINHPLPRVWRVNVAVGTADSVTYSVGAHPIR